MLFNWPFARSTGPWPAGHRGSLQTQFSRLRKDNEAVCFPQPSSTGPIGNPLKFSSTSREDFPGAKPRVDFAPVAGTTKEAAEKGLLLRQNARKSLPPGLKPSLISIGLTRGLKPRSPSEASFSAACKSRALCKTSP